MLFIIFYLKLLEFLLQCRKVCISVNKTNNFFKVVYNLKVFYQKCYNEKIIARARKQYPFKNKM